MTVRTNSSSRAHLAACLLRQRSRGFTLIEMLVVIGIISVLGGLVLSGVVFARQSARRKTTRMFLDTIAVALEHYRNDYSIFPDGAGDAASAGKLYRTLTERRGFGPYLTGLASNQTADTDRDGNPELVDAWGQPVRYTEGRYLADERDYELRSAGPDGEFDTDDDIVR